MSDLNWNGVYGFWVVARHGSFTKAADSLPRGSVQGLHKRVQCLESPQNLNLRLLRSRGVKGVDLTEAGRRLYELINPVFSEFDRVAGELRGEIAGPLHIAATAFCANNYIPDLIARFGPTHPEVSIHLHVAEHEELELLLATGRADLVLCAPKVLPPHTLTLARAPLRFGVVTPVRGKLLPANPGWENVVTHPLILPERSSVLRQAFEALMVRRDLSDRVRCCAEVTTPELGVECVRAGLGIALVAMGPRLSRQLVGVRYIAAPPGLPQHQLMLLCRRDRYLPKYMRDYVSVVKGVFARRWYDSGKTP